jgi:hypothetical protein
MGEGSPLDRITQYLDIVKTLFFPFVLGAFAPLREV